MLEKRFELKVKELEATIIKLIELSKSSDVWVGRDYIVFGDNDSIYQNRLAIPVEAFKGMKLKDYTKEEFIVDYKRTIADIN